MSLDKSLVRLFQKYIIVYTLHVFSVGFLLISFGLVMAELFPS